MDGNFNENDISRVVEADRANVWHHLIQHEQFFTGADPKIIVEGKGIKVWDQKGIEHTRCGFGRCLDRQRGLWPRKHRRRGA